MTTPDDRGPDAGDRIAAAPRRIRVVGLSGSGKSHLAARIADALTLPRLELDAVFWDAGWAYRPLAEAQGLVDAFSADHPEGWVVDGQWSSRLEGRLEPGTPGGAEAVVWLDLPRATVMRRLLTRTLHRGILRQELWHGNRERVSSWFRLDPDQNILRWAWTQHPVVRERMLARVAAGDPVIRLRSPREVDRWVHALAGAVHDGGPDHS